MKTRFRNEADQWVPEGSQITSPDNLAKIKRILEEEGPVLLQHWFYRGGSAPHYAVFDDYDELLVYLNQNAYAGDAIDIWSVWQICSLENRAAEGKCPDEQGLIPRGGAY